jgi:hypothetical protein
VSAIVTGYEGFTTAAGHVGPNYRVDHDNSMLAPELWCRMRVAERDARFLIANGYLEKVEDFQYEGRTVLASRLGYRITAAFVDRFLGRIFEMPGAVFPEELLRPEKQDAALFAAGVDAIVEAQRLVALNYFEDQSVEAACLPVKALLHIMAFGHYEGMTVSDPRVRAWFTRESLLESEWYRDRLRAKQSLDIALWTRHRDAGVATAQEQLARVNSDNYIADLVGTIGADPSVTGVTSTPTCRVWRPPPRITP